jgi:hypothetical protein
MLDEFTDYVDNLYVYNAMTGETTEIVDDLENEGGKTVIAWSPDEKKFIYSNDYLTVLFEAYGYFPPKQLLLADAATGRTTMLISDGYQFDVSPDQKQIAYSTGELLESKTQDQVLEYFGCFQPHLYDIDSSTSQLFDMSQLVLKPVCAGYPQWSPDGKKIAWMGYFEDDTFRPIVFNLEDKTGRVFDPLTEKPRSLHMPTHWFFGEPPFGGYIEPDWMDNSTFWTPSYEVNVVTGETTVPRQIDLPYYFRRNEYLQNPDGSLQVSLNEEGEIILVSDMDENRLASFPLDEIYKGPKQEILTSPFVLAGRTFIMGWSSFTPPPLPESN